MKNDLSLGDEIARVERRIEARRAHAVREYETAKADVAQRAARVTRFWPLAAVAGSLAVGIAAARRTRQPVRVVAAPVNAAQVSPAAARGILASLLAIAATGLRFAGSNEARTLWHALRAYRARRQAR